MRPPSFKSEVSDASDPVSLHILLDPAFSDKFRPVWQAVEVAHDAHTVLAGAATTVDE